MPHSPTKIRPLLSRRTLNGEAFPISRNPKETIRTERLFPAASVPQFGPSDQLPPCPTTPNYHTETLLDRLLADLRTDPGLRSSWSRQGWLDIIASTLDMVNSVWPRSGWQKRRLETSSLRVAASSSKTRRGGFWRTSSHIQCSPPPGTPAFRSPKKNSLFPE